MNTQSEESHTYAAMKESKQASLGIKKMIQSEEGIFTIAMVHTVEEEDENNCFISVGNTRLTELQTQEECERQIDEKDWRILWGVITHLVENRAIVDEARKQVTAKNQG